MRHLAAAVVLMAWYEYNSVDGILFDEASEGEMFLKINWGPLHETT